MMNRQHWIAVAIAALTSAGVWYYTLAQRAPGEQRLYAKTIPAKLGEWTGVDYPVAESVLRVLGTTDVLERHYRSSDRDAYVSFSVVFAQDNRTAVHAPEECLVGGGNQIVHRTILSYPVRMPGARVEPDPETQQLPADLGQGEETDLRVVELRLDRPDGPPLLVHFFYKSGRRVTHSYVRHEVDMLLSNVRRGTSTNALIKCTTPIGVPVSADEQEAARGRCREVMTRVFPYVMAALP